MAALGAGAETIGTVREISPAIDLDSRLGTVRIDLPGSSGYLFIVPGNFARGEIYLGKEPVLSIPIELCSLQRQPCPGLYGIAGGLAQMRFVEAGERDMGNIEIRQRSQSR